LYIVDTVNVDNLPSAQRELHKLLENPNLSGLPMVVACNKVDDPNHLNRREVEKALNIDDIDPNQQIIHTVEISALKGTNVDVVLNILAQYAKSK